MRTESLDSPDRRPANRKEKERSKHTQINFENKDNAVMRRNTPHTHTVNY